MPELLILILTALGSGGGTTILLAIVNKWLGKREERQDHDAQIRRELREDLTHSNDRVRELRRELDKEEDESYKWKRKYWALYELFSKLKMLTLSLANSDTTLQQSVNMMTAPHEYHLTNDRKAEADDCNPPQQK